MVLQHKLDADLLGTFLTNEGRLDVFACTTDIAFAETCCRKVGPVLTILDASFLNVQHMEVLGRLLCDNTPSSVLLLDAYYNHRHAKYATEKSLVYCTRAEPSDKLLELVKHLSLNGDTKSLPMDLVEKTQYRRQDCPIISKLSNRELEIFSLLGNGYSVRQCAETLQITPSTADNHKGRLMRKLDIHKMSEIVRLAIRLGLASK